MFPKQTQLQVVYAKDLLKKDFQETTVRDWVKQDSKGGKSQLKASFQVKFQPQPGVCSSPGQGY